MKLSSVRILAIVAVSALLSCSAEKNCSQPNQSNIEIGFSPPAPGEIGCTERLVNRITSANQSIYIQAYSFTSSEIGAALIKAHRKSPKLEIQIILDRSNQKDKHSLMGQMLAHGIPVYIDSSHAIAHNKVMIFDGQEVETGSFNFTRAAQHSNAENCFFVKDKASAQKYIDNWHRHREHSEPARK